MFSCFLSYPVIAQEVKTIDAYKAEDQGYFTNPVASAEGIIFTDNYDSKIWLLKDAQLKELASTAACGRYYTLSEDGQQLAYKEINAEGQQSPVVINLATLQKTVLHAPAPLCGQPVIAGNLTAFTVSNDLYLLQNGETRILPLGFYTNFIRISSNGELMTCNDLHDRIMLVNLVTGATSVISDEAEACFFPQFSPDGNKVLYCTSGQELRIFSITTGATVNLGYGVNPHWAPGSDKIIFHRTQHNNENISNVDLWMSSADGSIQQQLTSTSGLCEMDASFVTENEIIYHTYVRNEICKATIDGTSGALLSTNIVYSHLGNPIIAHYNTAPFSANKAVVTVPGRVPYVHQVYDTPNWHTGSGSCAPTSAIMAIAYYNKLPKWPITVSSPSSHTSDYGSYVADKYRFNEQYYSTVATTSGSDDAWGGYGYMWGGSCSPNSCMNQYMVNHQMSSTEYWTTCKWDSTTHEINNGWPQPICSLITTSGHLTLAIGYIVGQHTLIFKDPYGNKNTGYMNYYGDSVCYDWPGYSNGYASLNTIAWTVQSRTTETTYNDTIIDDIYYNHGFYMNNTAPSLMRYYRDKSAAGYNNHYWYTITNPSTVVDTCVVKWTPNLPQRSLYEVLVYIPSSYATATTARYKVNFDGGSTVVTINQNSYSNQWVSLGTFVFNAGSTGYVQLGDGSGIQGQYIAFDAVRWHKIGAIDNTDPTTLIQPISGWKTTSFTASFTDSDNAGGTGVESSYYQIQDYNGSEWRANSQNGFFNDQFSSSIHSDWVIPASSGSWSISSGHLRQSDAVLDNTNIYAPLTQNNSNEYLYQWSAYMDGSSVNRRCGLHIFADNPTQSQRGNSYLIWFRADGDQVQIYKTVSNSLVLKAEQSLVINTATWYDFKVTYNPGTGRIEVYMNDVLVLLYIDPAPLQSGSYISFRSGLSDAMFDDFKVSKLRSSSASVSVGSVSTNDVRYQNTNPITPACRINSIVKDLALNWSSAATTDVNIDWTAPTDPTLLNDGLSADVDTINSQILSANWATSTDPNSSIARYYIAAGTSAGATDIIGYTDNLLATSFSQSHTLVDGQLYYFSVYAENGAGLISGTSMSDGQRYVNLTAVEENTDQWAVSVFPNPVHKEAMLSLSLENNEYVDISIVDITGRIVNRITPGGLSSGIQLIRLNTETLSSGTYFLHIAVGSETYTKKILVY